MTRLPINHYADTNLKCPECETKLVLRNGKYGEFYGCKNFPKCRYTCSADYEDREMQDYFANMAEYDALLND